MIAMNVRPRLDNPAMATILGAIGSGRGGGPDPMKLEDGLFKCSHWSFDQYLGQGWDKWWEGPDEDGMPPEYGVCDSPAQFKETYLEKLRDDSRYEYVVSFVHLRKADEPASGGWRWHKWGEYVGAKSPQCEYLHDEPEIEEVYTFHVYRRPVGKATHGS